MKSLTEVFQGLPSKLAVKTQSFRTRFLRSTVSLAWGKYRKVQAFLIFLFARISAKARYVVVHYCQSQFPKETSWQEIQWQYQYWHCWWMLFLATCKSQLKWVNTCNPGSPTRMVLQNLVQHFPTVHQKGVVRAKGEAYVFRHFCLWQRWHEEIVWAKWSMPGNALVTLKS